MPTQTKQRRTFFCVFSFFVLLVLFVASPLPALSTATLHLRSICSCSDSDSSRERRVKERDRERERASVSCAPLATCCGQHVPAADGLLEAVIRCVCKACKRGAARAGVVDGGRGEGGAGVEATLRLFS